MDFKAPHILETHLNLPRFRVEGILEAMATMLCELKVKTLQGGDLTIKVVPTTTIKELKAMLREKKHCEDPIEHKILKVKVLADGLLVDADQTLESAGLSHPEAEVTPQHLLVSPLLGVFLALALSDRQLCGQVGPGLCLGSTWCQEPQSQANQGEPCLLATRRIT